MKSVATLLLVLLSGSIAAKCIDVRQEIVGVVVDVDGKPIGGAIVEASWRERGQVVTRIEQTDANGRFTLYIIFNAYSHSSPLGEDRCEGKFEMFSVSASRAGFVDAFRTLQPSTEPIKLRLSLERGAPKANKTMEPTR